MDEPVVHLLTCATLPRDPPKTPDEFPQQPAAFREEPWTIQFVYSMFPDAASSHAVHDLHSKQKEHVDPPPEPVKPGSTIVRCAPGSKRIDVRVLIREDGLLERHTELARTYLEIHNHGIAVIYGEDPIRFAIRDFNIAANARAPCAELWGIYENVTIGGQQRIVVLMPHPAWMGVYASQAKLKRVVVILERLAIDFDVTIDISRLQARVRAYASSAENEDAAKYPQLRHLTIPCRSPEEIRLERNRRQREMRRIGTEPAKQKTR